MCAYAIIFSLRMYKYLGTYAAELVTPYWVELMGLGSNCSTIKAQFILSNSSSLYGSAKFFILFSLQITTCFSHM